MTHLTLHEELYETRIENNKIKAERDSLIDDIAVLRANNKRLERENKRLEQENRILFHRDTELHENINDKLKKINSLVQENKALRLQSDAYFDEWQNIKNLYTTLTEHIRQKAEANPNVDRYIALVNYIDRLEKGES